MLRDLGHTVIEAAGADEALALAELPDIGLVLSDIGLPGGRSGVDLVEALAARGSTARLYLMTSLPPADPLRRRAAAQVPVLTKPFSEAELAAFLAPEAAA